jgi:hypothetical protein
LFSVQAGTVAAVWSEHGPQYVQHLRGASLTPSALTGVQWRLALDVGSSAATAGRTAAAVFHLQTGEDGFYVQMDRAGLEALYTQLEAVQSQLDSLKS